MKRLAALVLACAPLAAPAQPQEAQMCAGCHGAGGAGGHAPPLAGQPEIYIERQLEAFADGRRANEEMTPIAKSLQPEAFAPLAAHFSALPPAAKTVTARKGPARARLLATRGDERLQVQACQNCHGPGGIGQGTLPYIAGLDRKYLASTLREWKSGRRDTDPSGQMQAIARRLGDKDIAALAAYFGATRAAGPAGGSPGGHPAGKDHH